MKRMLASAGSRACISEKRVVAVSERRMVNKFEAVGDISGSVAGE